MAQTSPPGDKPRPDPLVKPTHQPTRIHPGTASIEPAKRLPHERDESFDSQDKGEPRPVIQQAQEDLAQGRVDTDRGTPMDEVYQRTVETSPDAAHPPRRTRNAPPDI